jgi:hypothetical protein
MQPHHLEWDKQGLFIAPHESAVDYEARIQALFKHLDPAVSSASSPEVLQRVFGVDPSWVRVEYSKKGLYPWEAGCTWYDTVPWIQLHPCFLTSQYRFGIYSKEEVLAHEYVHVVRAPLESDRFEEFFAYLISYYAKPGIVTSLRTFLGPLFDKPWQVIVAFVSFLAFPIAGLLVVACLFARLLYCWRQFFLCKKQLQSITDTPLQLMLRLNDSEIVRFSKMSKDEITAYIAEKGEVDFRWQLLQKMQITGTVTSLFS